MDDLYREQILEHYKRPHHWGELENPDMEYFDTNPLCGDELKVQISVAGLVWGIPGTLTMVLHDRRRARRRALTHPDFQVVEEKKA